MHALTASNVLATMCVMAWCAAADDTHYVIQQLKAVIEQQEKALESQQRILDVLKPPTAPQASNTASSSRSAQPIVHTIDERHMEHGPERLYYIEEFFSAADIEVLLNGEWRAWPLLTLSPAQTSSDAERNFERSATIGAEEDGGVQIRNDKPVRRSDTAYVRQEEASPEILDSIQRMHDIARMPSAYGEELQVTRYLPGDYYQFHWDSHVKNGGHTVFPGARWRRDPATRELVEGVLRSPLPPPSSALWSTAGLPPLGESHESAQPDMQQFCDHPGVVRIPPVAGNALLWFNHDAELDLDWATLHGGCPPKGTEEKLIAQRWVRWFKDDENNFYSVMKECGVIED